MVINENLLDLVGREKFDFILNGKISVRWDLSISGRVKRYPVTDTVRSMYGIRKTH